jgi:glucose-1-phosphate thymidylyltransferase
MKAIIAAGGSGTRLRPLTFSSNKQLLPILNKPLLLYPFEAIVETGIKEIGLVVNETRPAIEKLLGDGSAWGVKVSYIDQAKPLGLAHVVKICKEFLDGQPFVYLLGDNIFTDGIMVPFKKFVETNPDGLLTYIKHKENKRLGVPYFDEQGKLVEVVEKPENPPNEYGVPGLYMFGPRVFDAFEGDDAVKPSPRGELEITDLYTYLLKHNYTVETEKIGGSWLDPGKFDDMISTNHVLMDLMEDGHHQARVDEASEVVGTITSGNGSTISESRIIGPVCIGENVTIKNCTVGPYVTIGSGCTISNAAITNSVVYDNAVIEKTNRVIVDSLIGKNTRVWEAGHGSISLFIGDYCNVRIN